MKQEPTGAAYSAAGGIPVVHGREDVNAFPEGYRPFAACTVADPTCPPAAGHVMEAKTIAGTKVVFVALHDEDLGWNSFPPSSVVLTGAMCTCASAERYRH